MITKFKNISNLAVFQNFNWDTDIQDNIGNILEFKKINIIYGRNYSGKTTLSRIVRALETGNISDKYDNPAFEVCIKDNSNVYQNNLLSHSKTIRVFNEDFVKNNLRVISNPEDSINPIVIPGGNADIQSEITTLKTILGENESGNKTGFYLELENANYIASLAQSTFNEANKKLSDQLKNKAINNTNGIKYKPNRFGDQNYNSLKIEADLLKVINPSFIPITDVNIEEIDILLKENVNPDIKPISKPVFDISGILSRAEILISKPISSSNKIELLVKNAILNRWVKEGKLYHKDNLDKCSFCGSDITEERWKQLDSHFDEESDKLETEIDALIVEIQNQISLILNCLNIDKSVFYSKYHKEIDQLIASRQTIIDEMRSDFENIISQLINRKKDLLNSKVFVQVKNHNNLFDDIWKEFEKIRLDANFYTASLENEKREAREKLRLREVFDFANAIQYSSELKRLEELDKDAKAKIKEKDDIAFKIQMQIKAIEDKERSMKDEEKGALKVNEYLNNFFGHDFLTLKALEEPDQFDGKKIRFEIQRNDKKAFHLSEGECSLVAFCYFMAKLADIDTIGSNPILWIDDPISSLDSNHIFFIYSLINSEIVAKQSFEQLFISTHNLDFLKYLKRLPDANDDFKKRENKKVYQYFIVQRIGMNSSIQLMPNYLREYVTEFNYLFKQLYICSLISKIDDTNYTSFYNFGNNARKFLEIFLYYKYPDSSRESEKMKRFFGDENIPTVLIDRVNNEYSHLCGIFERGSAPIEVPEMNKTAKFILDKIKENDEDQYNSLLNSIGIQIIT